MPSRELLVYLDGTFAGVVEMSSTGALTFSYDEAYRLGDEPTPLSLSMPLELAQHRNRVVRPYLQGLLPDNAQALDAIAATYSVSAGSPFALLEHVGRDVAGAVQFMRQGDPAPDAVGTRTRVRVLTDLEVTERLQEAIDEYRNGSPFTRQDGRFSLAGAQPKIALHRSGDGAWGIPEDATPTTHILKPDAGFVSQIDVTEQLTLEAARNLGLNVAESSIMEFGSLATLVSKRYDRATVDGRAIRLHQEDLGQALSVMPVQKYQRQDGGPGVADIARLSDVIPLASDRREFARDFFRGFVFNVVAAGTDAHAKNYSVMLQGASVRLAPLYDLVSWAPYWDRATPILLPMNVNGKYDAARISSKDLVAVGRKLRLPAEEAEEIVERTRSGMVVAFHDAAAKLKSVDFVDPYMVDLFAKGVAALPLPYD